MTRYRELASRERSKAAAETLPNVRERLLRSAEQWDQMADRFQRMVKSGR